LNLLNLLNLLVWMRESPHYGYTSTPEVLDPRLHAEDTKMHHWEQVPRPHWSNHKSENLLNLVMMILMPLMLMSESPHYGYTLTPEVLGPT
jgi:hypothetical protein